MLSSLAAWLFRLWGWKITGDFPFHEPKLIIAVGPHTSNWDFPVGVLTKSTLRANIKWAGKSTLFRWPFGGLFRWLGGVPVVRDRRTNFVDGIVKAFAEHDHLWLTIAPEGTRKKVEKLKTGFYHIARLAGVPVVFCVFDWTKREVFFDKNLFRPTGDEAKDLEFVWNYFKGIPGHTPENGVF